MERGSTLGGKRKRSARAIGFTLFSKSRRACDALSEFRAGAVSFDDVVVVLRPILMSRARYFERKIRQTLDDREDMLRVMELATWRAVDKWNPSHPRAGSLAVYVDNEVGRAIQRELRQHAGWPDARRSALAQQVAVERVVRGRSGSSGFNAGSAGRGMLDRSALYIRLDGLFEPEPPCQDRVVEGRERVASLLERLDPGLSRHVVELVVKDGFTLDGVAGVLYENWKTRLLYRFDSPKHARYVVGVAALRATKAAWAISA